MNAAALPVSLTFIAYLLVMLVIGWLAWRRTKNLSDYILGGRRLGPWVAALSAGASDMSGWLLLGLPGYAYAAGFEAFWIGVGLLVGTWLNWKLLARPLRIYSELAGNALTIPAFLANRFLDNGQLLRLVSAGFILLFFLFYTASGLVAGGKLFNSVFGMPYEWAVAAGAAAILLYTLVGGFLAVSWTDLLQGLLMLAALLLVPVLAMQSNGGLQPSLDQLQQTNPALLDPLTDANGEALGVIAIVSLLGWGLGYFGQPHILARFKAIQSPASIPLARRIAVSWSGLSMLGAVLVGVAGVGFLSEPLTGGDSEKVFMQLVSALFHPVIGGVLLAAILAAIMSTADSQLLVASAALTEDFYKHLVRRDASPNELVRIGRLAVLLVAGIAFLLALDEDSKVLDLVAYAWAGFGAAFGPTLLLAVYWHGMNRTGAIAGILTGGLTVVIWKQLEGGWFDLYEIVPGVLLSTLAILIVSRLTGGPSSAVAEQHRVYEQNR